MRNAIAGMLLLAAAPAAAQDGWDFAITPYVWLPGLTNKLHTDTRFGTIEYRFQDSRGLRPARSGQRLRHSRESFAEPLHRAREREAHVPLRAEGLARHDRDVGPLEQSQRYVLPARSWRLTPP